MLYTADNSFGDVEGKVVADFGCGCGTLGVAAALSGADHVMGIDIDPESLDIASCNADDLELRFDVPQLDKFHKKKEVDIAVDLWRFTPGNSGKSRI